MRVPTPSRAATFATPARSDAVPARPKDRETADSDSDSPTPASDSSGRVLARAAQLGDPAAFDKLYRLYSRRVYALCLRMVENTAAAEDITQEIFLTVFRKIHLFRGDSAFYTWLHRIAINTVLMHFRKNSHSSPSLDDLVSRHEEAGEDSFEAFLSDPRPNFSLDSINLERAIDCLPVKYQLAVILHDVHGYKHNEIAEIAGITIMNSKSILCRARIRLRELLDPGDRVPRRNRSHIPSAASADESRAAA
jgi:RNA polymerase sigma-70 factor, ECF subfamily